MPQTTEVQRVNRIAELLREALKQPPEKQPEGERLPAIGGGDALVCPVITIGVDEVVLNPNSHRIKAQLQDEPEWATLKNDPYSEPSQLLIRRLVREARKPDAFKDLQKSLLDEGQDYPGVITHRGVLINANTRAVAIAEFENPAKRFIRVAVLPSTVQEDQLALLELRLQMRKEMKADYSLTNELLFIEELFQRGLAEKQIAAELRIFPDSAKKGEKEVQTRLQILDLIRELQQIPAERPKLTFFDTLALEQFRELLRERDALLQIAPAEAERLMESFLLSTAVGITPVHSLRQIDSSFMDTYMYPQLEEDEELGSFAEDLAKGGEGKATGGDGVLDLPDEDGEDCEIDLKRLIDVVVGDGNRVRLPGSRLNVERAQAKEAIAQAVKTGIKEKRRDARDEDKLEAPLSAVKAATKQVIGAAASVKDICDDPEFGQTRRKSLEAAFKKLRRRHGELEKTLSELEILGS
ncbi:MAG: hypothetical protein U0R71_01355 [Solirubrobacterales bacterium]